MGGRDDLAQVVVDGWGPLAEELSAQLRRCLVDVCGGAHAADGAEIALDADAVPPAVVVVVAQGRAPGWAGAPWQARGIPHLPLVLPAARSSSARSSSRAAPPACGVPGPRGRSRTSPARTRRAAGSSSPLRSRP